MLAEDPHTEDEKEKQPQGQDGLNQGQRRVRQRQDLERPAEQREQRRADPERARQQVADQRRFQCLLGGRLARLDRLQRVARLVAAGRRERQTEAEGEILAHW